VDIIRVVDIDLQHEAGVSVGLDLALAVVVTVRIQVGDSCVKQQHTREIIVVFSVSSCCYPELVLIKPT
jgi:hypothetical protein